MHEVEIDLNLEDYWFDAKSPFDDTKDACYIPIFVSDARQEFAVFRTWFLGNMFMDKYFIINDMSNALNQEYTEDHRPRVGIYKKPESYQVKEEPAFLQ